MTSGHVGVPVAALPGTGGSGGGLLSGLFGGTPDRSTVGAAPVPPGNVGATASAQPRGASPGLDGWLLDNLFGRR